MIDDYTPHQLELKSKIEKDLIGFFTSTRVIKHNVAPIPSYLLPLVDLINTYAFLLNDSGLSLMPKVKRAFIIEGGCFRCYKSKDADRFIYLIINHESTLSLVFHDFNTGFKQVTLFSMKVDKDVVDDGMRNITNVIKYQIERSIRIIKGEIEDHNLLINNIKK